MPSSLQGEGEDEVKSKEMKYISNQIGEWLVKKDYSKKIIFSPEDFVQTGHMLQLVTIPPQTKQRVHHHTQQTEVFYILEGKCMMYFNEQEFIARPGDSYICEPGDKHYLWNKTDKEFKLVVFKVDYPENDDTVWEEN